MIKTILDEEINHTIAEQIQQFGKMYLLVDPQINDNFFFDNYFEFESIVPIRDRQDTVSQDHELLQLCAIPKQTTYIEQLIIELKNKKSAAIALIASPYSIKYIQNHISNAMFMSYNGSKYLLRFYDSHVLKHLIEILNEKQLNNLLGCIEYWYYWQNSYTQLHHKPELILSDIQYQLSPKQWLKIEIAQICNAYEYQLAKQQQKPLSNTEQRTLKQILDWIYKVTFYRPNQQKMDVIIHYAMAQPEQFFRQINDDLLFELMTNQNINQLEQYLKNLD